MVGLTAAAGIGWLVWSRLNGTAPLPCKDLTTLSVEIRPIEGMPTREELRNDPVPVSLPDERDFRLAWKTSCEALDQFETNVPFEAFITDHQVRQKDLVVLFEESVRRAESAGLKPQWNEYEDIFGYIRLVAVFNRGTGYRAVTIRRNNDNSSLSWAVSDQPMDSQRISAGRPIRILDKHEFFKKLHENFKQTLTIWPHHETWRFCPLECGLP